MHKKVGVGKIDGDAKERVRIVARAEVAPALTHGRVRAAREALGFRSGELFYGVAVPLRDRERRVQKAPVEKITQHAKPPAVGRADAAIYEHEPVLIGSMAVGAACKTPEGKRLARVEDYAVHCFGGKTEVVHLVLLILHRKTAALIAHGDVGAEKRVFKRRFCPHGGVAAAVKVHFEIKAALSLPAPQRKQKRKALREPFSCHRKSFSFGEAEK